MTYNLNAVAIDVVGQYGLAGKHLVNAYRLGTQRAAAKLTERYTSMMQSSAMPLVDPSVRVSILSAHAQLTGFFINGVARATEQADLAIDKITDSTAQGIKRLGGVGERFEAMVGTPVVETMTKINMPAAQLSLQIAGQVAEGSKRLVERVAAVEDAVEATVVAATDEVKARTKRATAAA
jgi:hypothetical protein